MRLERPSDTIAELLLCAALFVWIYVQALAVPYPSVFSDEATYSLLSKFGGGATTQNYIGLPIDYPDHLFFLTYRIAHLFRDNFLEAAKLLNALFLAVSVFPIHRLCRLLLTPGYALLATVIAIAGPYAIFATFFMPESMYFLGFWAYAYAVVALWDRSRMLQAAIQGFILGTLALVKPHAVILLLPSAIALAFAADGGARWLGRFGRVVACICVLVFAFAITKSALTFLLSAELSFAGEGYLHYLMSGASLTSTISRISAYWFVLRGHVAFLLLLCVPFLVAIALGFAGLRAPEGRPEARRGAFLAIFASSVILSLLIATVKFTADVAGSGPYETIERVHGRYYEFALPLLAITSLTFAESASRAPMGAPRGRWLAGVAWIALVCLYVGFEAGGEYSRHLRAVSDFASSSLLGQRQYRILLAVVVFASSALMIWKWRRAAVVTGAAACVVLLGSELSANAILRRIEADAGDRLALAVKNLIPVPEIDKGVVVANEADGRLFRVMFHLNSLSRALVLPKGIAVRPEDIDPDRKWVLLLDQRAVAIPEQRRIDGADFTLVELSPVTRPKQLDQDDVRMDNIYDRVMPLASSARVALTMRGFHGAESWGAWTAKPTVTIELPRPIAGRFDLHVRGWTFGDNVGKPLSITIGSQTRQTSFYSRMATIDIPFEITQPASSVTIGGIVPQSPTLVHAYNDPRSLGLAIESLTVHRVKPGS